MFALRISDPDAIDLSMFAKPRFSLSSDRPAGLLGLSRACWPRRRELKPPEPRGYVGSSPTPGTPSDLRTPFRIIPRWRSRRPRGLNCGLNPGEPPLAHRASIGYVFEEATALRQRGTNPVIVARTATARVDIPATDLGGVATPSEAKLNEHATDPK